MQQTDPNSPELLKRGPEAFRIRVVQLAKAGENVENRVIVPEETTPEALPAQEMLQSPSLSGYHANQEALEKMSAVDAARLLAEQARNN